VKREFSKEEFSVRLTWLTWSRVLLTVVLVASLLFFQRSYQIYSFHNSILYYLVLIVFALTALYRYLIYKVQDKVFLAYLQTSADILIISYLVLLTGGIDSGLSILYHLTIISSSIILQRRGGYLAASLSSILYGAMLDMQFYNMYGLTRSQTFTAGQVLYQVLVNIISFYSVAFLSGYLSERLRTARQELRTKSTDLNELRELQDQILRSVGSGILTIDLQGNITSWNPAAEHITGYVHDDISKHWKSLFKDSIKELFGHTETLKERPLRFNSIITKQDGSTAVLGIAASLLKDETSAPRGIILTFQDITKIIALENQIRRQERLATVGSLAAGIAHEIRNPLASLSGSIQLLKTGLDLKDDDRKLMDIVVRETDRLNTIITEFLEYARPQNIKNESIDLPLILDETIMLIRNSPAYSENIIIKQDITPGLKITGDSQRLRQVFWNLLINACQSIAAIGSISITAKPYTALNDGTEWCEILIDDTGTGISSEHLANIFTPFFTTKTDGTGLGLAITYRIIEDHHGSISVESIPDKFTRFSIKLPLKQDYSDSVHNVIAVE